jgi:polyisoprenoid-binding protein YceI
VRKYRKILATSAAAISMFVAACGSPAVSQTAPIQASNAVVSTAPASQAVTVVSASSQSAAATPTTASATTMSAESASAVTFNVVASGTKADYRVREQLARLNAPSDAVGTTTGVTGSIVLGADGKIVSNQSKLVVDLTKLQSDSNMRDGFIARGTLDTASYPNATFVPTAISGLPTPLPSTGQYTFQLTGNLTVHGVTKPVTWAVTAQVNGNDVTGQATTSFKFEDFGMSPPQSMMVLSVVDDVKLEVTLHLTKS